MKYGYLRVGAVSPKVKVANCGFNADSIINAVEEANVKDIKVLAFPELCLTSVTCGDLYLQSALLEEVLVKLEEISLQTKECDVLFAVGAPLYKNEKLYSCAVVMHKGKILGVIPKKNISVNDRRFFEPFKEDKNSKILLNGKKYDFGSKLIFECENLNLKVAFELGEDLNVPNSPSISHSLAGANLIVNLANSNEIVGKKEYREKIVSTQSAKLVCAYLYATNGDGESTTDLVYSGHSLVCENGEILVQNELFEEGIISTEIDLELLQNERRNILLDIDSTGYKFSKFSVNQVNYDLSRKVCPSPFKPINPKDNYNRAMEIINLQARGLKKRMEHINCKSAVIGVSGGLDSTLALLVIAKAFDLMGLDHKGIYAITMPCFGTSKRTYDNSFKLSNALGINLKEINIKESVLKHFEDIGHDRTKTDITFENSQARERTQILMDFSNMVNGIVIGTGDLSELALGWATYNGDHMSMYGVNASVPKTLVQFVVEEYAKNSDNEELKKVLLDILYTPISPELLPTKDGVIAQKTEDNVGPYELHDFFLYYAIRYGFTPEKIYMMSKKAFGNSYSDDVLKKWLRNFYWRFFAQQFKRSCSPDGVKVGSVALSPRGAWNMPSDASSEDWIKRIERL